MGAFNKDLPGGVLVVQDDANTTANGTKVSQNFKIVSWAALRRKLESRGK
jgi:myo-inositol-hexaphosphate 3-phosphohydrolase